MNYPSDFFFFFFTEPQASEFLHRFRGTTGLEETWDEIQRDGAAAQMRQLPPGIQQLPLDGRCLDWFRGCLVLRNCFLFSKVCTLYKEC